MSFTERLGFRLGWQGMLVGDTGVADLPDFVDTFGGRGVWSGLVPGAGRSGRLNGFEGPGGGSFLKKKILN